MTEKSTYLHIVSQTIKWLWDAKSENRNSGRGSSLRMIGKEVLQRQVARTGTGEQHQFTLWPTQKHAHFDYLEQHLVSEKVFVFKNWIGWNRFFDLHIFNYGWSWSSFHMFDDHLYFLSVNFSTISFLFLLDFLFHFFSS